MPRKKPIEKKYPKPKRRAEKFLIQEDVANLFDKDSRHVKERFKVSQKKDRDGTITLTLRPHKEIKKDREKMIKQLAPALAKCVDNVALMKDILEDVSIYNLDKLKTAIDRGAKVTPKEGCFYLSIKDPRKKKPMRMSLRD